MVEKSKAKSGPATAAARKVKITKEQVAQVVEKTRSKAEEYARDPEKGRKLLDDAIHKARSFQENRGPFGEVR